MRSRGPAGICRSWGLLALCAASDFRRMTAGSSRPSWGEAAFLSRFEANRGRPMRWPFYIPTGAGTRRSERGRDASKSVGVLYARGPGTRFAVARHEGVRDTIEL